MNEHTFNPTAPALNKERPFLPRINDGGILGRLGECQETFEKQEGGYIPTMFLEARMW